jgi:hypothetical protein
MTKIAHHIKSYFTVFYFTFLAREDHFWSESMSAPFLPLSPAWAHLLAPLLLCPTPPTARHRRLQCTRVASTTHALHPCPAQDPSSPSWDHAEPQL